MQAFNLNTSSKIADSNLIATPHRCQPFSTGETHLNSFDRTGFPIAFPFRSVDRSLDPALGLLMCDESMLLFTPKIPFSIR